MIDKKFKPLTNQDYLKRVKNSPYYIKEINNIKDLPEVGEYNVIYSIPSSKDDPDKREAMIYKYGKYLNLYTNTDSDVFLVQNI